MQISELRQKCNEQEEMMKNLEHANKMKDRGCSLCGDVMRSDYVLECGDQQDEAGNTLFSSVTCTVLFRVFWGLHFVSTSHHSFACGVFAPSVPDIECPSIP